MKLENLLPREAQKKIYEAVKPVSRPATRQEIRQYREAQKAKKEQAEKARNERIQAKRREELKAQGFNPPENPIQG